MSVSELSYSFTLNSETPEKTSVVLQFLFNTMFFLINDLDKTTSSYFPFIQISIIVSIQLRQQNWPDWVFQLLEMFSLQLNQSDDDQNNPNFPRSPEKEL